MDLQLAAEKISRLTDHDWLVLSSRWARGINWIVTIRGRRWGLSKEFGDRCTFKTKDEAWSVANKIVLEESRRRKGLAK